MRRWHTLLVIAALFAGCNRSSVKYEDKDIGYRGAARLDPFLAAERFIGSYDRPVTVTASWHAPTQAEAVWFVPPGIIGNITFAREMESWMQQGGHLICLVDRSEPDDDWIASGTDFEPDPALEHFLDTHGIELVPVASPTTRLSKVPFRGLKYEIETQASREVSVRGVKSGVLASIPVGSGRLTVLSDARPFRNRWIEEHQHAALLKALVDTPLRGGGVVFIRGTVLSLWSMLLDRAWALLLGLGILLVFWLWKNLPRFGPLEATEPPSPLRGYDHHLEALGDFQWRLDKGATMLGPIREEIIERANRLLARSSRLDADIFAVLAERAGIPRERAHRALAEPAPSDASVFTRTVRDLQAILKTLN